MAMSGTQVLLLANTPTGFQAVAEQTSLSIEESVNLIEAGSKDSPHQKYLYGKAEGTLTLESLYVPDDSAYQALKNAQRNREIIKIRRKEGSQEVEEADALVETISTEFPDDDVATVSVDLTLNSDWTQLV